MLDGAKKVLTCLDVEKGEKIWEEPLEATKTFYASPTVADGKIYMIDLAGEVFVYEASNEPKLLSQWRGAGTAGGFFVLANNRRPLLSTGAVQVCSAVNRQVAEMILQPSGERSSHANWLFLPRQRNLSSMQISEPMRNYG